MKFFHFISRSLQYIHNEAPKRVPAQYYTLQRIVAKEEPVIIDGGAHRGQTIAYIKSIFPRGRVIAFEPSSEAFRDLSKASANYRDVVVENLALHRESGILPLNINSYSQTNSLLASALGCENFWGSSLLDKHGEENVRTVTLDEYCENKGIMNIDILKLDLQGSEMLALTGGNRLLSNQRINYIVIEIILVSTYIGQSTIQEYFNFLYSKGYGLIGIFNQVIKDCRLLQADFLFERIGLNATPQVNQSL